jgi:hypothetical protein
MSTALDAQMAKRFCSQRCVEKAMPMADRLSSNSRKNLLHGVRPQ